MYRTLVWEVLQPFTLLWLLVALAVANLWRKRQESRRRLLLLTIPFLVLTIFSLPMVSALLVASLEWQYAPLTGRPADTAAIVVLAGYVYPPPRAGVRPEPDESTCNRCRKAVEMYKQGARCRVLVSGGNTKKGINCAENMRDFLLELGVKSDDLIVERNSETTYDNAVESAKLLQACEISRIVLITDAAHMLRAVRCFQKQGLEVVPCSCQYRIVKLEVEPSSFLPQLGAAKGCQQAFHEWLGLAWYWLRGRI